MQYVLNMPEAGDSTFRIKLDAHEFNFRIYYCKGQFPIWLIDVADTAGVKILTGVALRPGKRNIFRGYSLRLQRVGCMVVAQPDKYNYILPNPDMYLLFYDYYEVI